MNVFQKRHRLFCTEKTYGEYTLLSQLGEGRYGVCHLAENSSGERVVLKQFKQRMLKKNNGKNHFEAVMLSQLNHPAIPAMLGVVNSHNRYFFVLEYIPAKTLAHCIFQEKKAFSKQEILKVGWQLIGIIEYLHKNGIVHRDLSIYNILYDQEQIFVVDFGLARFIDGCRYQADIDFSYFADVLLYLLYSSYTGKRSVKKPWHEELPLRKNEIVFLQKLLGMQGTFQSIQEVKREFLALYEGERFHSS